MVTSETAAAEASETFLRARRPEQKQQRREEILAAARELALADGVRSVSLAGIAALAGIDKSALLRYFETREQIFLELTAREWPAWVQALHDGLDGADPASAGTAGPGPSLVADVVARSFGDRPLFCDLLAHTPLNLERNVSPEAVRGYKLISLAAVGEAADVVHRVLPDLTGAGMPGVHRRHRVAGGQPVADRQPGAGAGGAVRVRPGPGARVRRPRPPTTADGGNPAGRPDPQPLDIPGA